MIQIVIFIAIIYGLGTIITYRNPALFAKLSFGFALIPIIGVILNILHIPLDWRVFLGLALIAPGYGLLRWWKGGRHLPGFQFKRPSGPTLVVAAIFIFTLFIYCWGPFQYTWLEDDDSWAHAAGVKYIAIEKNLNAPDGTFQYLNPYPPGYDLIIGLMHQVNPSLYWCLKFFNGFFICLGFLMFYLLAREMTRDAWKAALALLFLALMPCYLTHFIWAHGLVLTYFFAAFYFLIKSFKDRSYVIPAAVCSAAVALTQPTQAVKFAIMAALLIMAYIPTKIRWKHVGAVILIAGILSLLWWGPVLWDSLAGQSHITFRDGEKITGTTAETAGVAKGAFSPTSGSATQAYSWKHYLYIEHPNLINNPTGLGPMIVILSGIGFIFSIFHLFTHDPRAPGPYRMTTLLWLGFTFLGMNSVTFHLPVGLFAFRFWMLFAIPVSLLCAEGLYAFTQLLQCKWNKILVAGLLIASVLRVNLPFKWRFNTKPWPYGVHWTSDDDINGYIWMREKLLPNTKVFAFTDNVLVLGHDMRADFWTEDYTKRFGHAFQDDIKTLYSNLEEKDYDCLVISPRDIREFGREEVNAKIKALLEDKRFRIIFSNPAVKIFQVLR